MDKKLHETYREVEMTHWWFLGRRQLVYQLFKKFFLSLTPARISVLDVGCNSGVLVGELQKQGYQASGCDISVEAIAAGQARGVNNLALTALETMPYSNNQFDVITCLDTLEHIKNDVGALQMLDRKLKPGGIIICTVPAFRFLWGLQDEVSHHFRRYTKQELVTTINQNVSWQIERATYFNTFLFLPILIFRKFQSPSNVTRDSDFEINGPVVNAILKTIFLVEIFLLRLCSFPFGVSLLVVARKK